MDAIWLGPQPRTHDQRLELAAAIVDDLHRTYGQAIHAIALCGSMARDEDGAYSDVELLCALTTPGVDHADEWVYGPGKAEVDIYGLDVLWEMARSVEADWALTQGTFVNLRPLYGDPAFFAELRHAVLNPDPATVHTVIAEMIVGECYEWIGKLRNAMHSGRTQSVPTYAMRFAEHVACIAGLLHTTLFTTGSTMLSDALEMGDLPAGYKELAQHVMQGNLADADATVADIEALWAGLEPWLTAHGVDVTHRTQWPWP